MGENPGMPNTHTHTAWVVQREHGQVNGTYLDQRVSVPEEHSEVSRRRLEHCCSVLTRLPEHQRLTGADYSLYTVNLVAVSLCEE